MRGPVVTFFDAGGTLTYRSPETSSTNVLILEIADMAVAMGRPHRTFSPIVARWGAMRHVAAVEARWFHE